MSSTSETKWVILECPGKKVPIRQEPKVTAELIRYASSGDKLEVHVKTTSGFFRLKNKQGFINRATKGVEWIDIPVEVNEEEPEEEENEADISIVSEYVEPNHHTTDAAEQLLQQEQEPETYQDSEEFQSDPQFDTHQPEPTFIPTPVYETTTEALNPSPPTTARSTDSLVASSAKMAINSKLGGSPKCAVCDKAVYPAEKVQAIDQIWHKTCFCCGGNSSDGGCKKVLTLDKYLTHGNDPFCKACHGRLFGPKGFGYSLTGGAMTTNEPTHQQQDLAPRYSEENGSNVGGMNSNNSSPHPPPPARPSMSPRSASVQEYFSSTNNTNTSIPPRPAFKTASSESDALQYAYVSQNTAKPSLASRIGEGAPKCAVCIKAVYPAEKVQAINLIWHKTCFTCGGSSQDGGCGKVLTLDKYLSHGEDPFCKACHGKLFGPKGYGYGMGAGVLSSYEQSTPRLSSSSANNSSKNLAEYSEPQSQDNNDINNYNGNENGGNGGDGYSLSQQSEQDDNNNSNNYQHQPQNTPAPTNSPVSPRETVFVSSYVSPTKSTVEQITTTPTKASPLASRFGSAAPKCALCVTSVFPAEKTQAINRIWHKTCFKCGGTSNDGGCGKVLTLDKYLSHGEDPFCKACHGKLFGPKGFGFGGAMAHHIPVDN